MQPRQPLRIVSLAWAAGLLFATGAQAAEYTQLQPQASKITFDYQQMGVGRARRVQNL